MATSAQCAYCFEVLASSLDKRPALHLSQIEELWDKFSGDSAVDELDDALDAHDLEEDTESTLERADTAKPAAISRLLAPQDPSSSSSSSSRNSSTPSVHTQGSSTTTTSTSSFSRSSIFSFGRRKKPVHSEEQYPVFVTWNTVSSRGHKSLRGCIGTFEPHDLDDGLRSYALTSAFDDHRFHPISLAELPSLECGVTLLTDFESASSPMAWELGKHGLRISFTYHGRRYGSTYLPDVPVEQGWTKEETIVSLMRKAGWTGRKDEWRKVGDLKVVTYQGTRSSLEYKRWKEFRGWVVEQGL